MRRILLAALLLLAAPSAAAAKPFTVGTGQNPGVAIDDAGTVYVGWQVNTYQPGDAVQLCLVPPRQARCGSQVTIPFPGQGYNRSRVSVLLPGPNMVDVIVPRTNGRSANSYLARSLDGGHTFGPAVAIAGDGFLEGVQGPGGRVALVDGPTTTRAGLFAPDGSSVRTRGSALGPFLEGVFTDIAASGEEVLAAGSDAGRPTHSASARAAIPTTSPPGSSSIPPRAASPRSRACPAASRSCSSPRAPPPASCSCSASRVRRGHRPSPSSRPSTTTATSSRATPRAA